MLSCHKDGSDVVQNGELAGKTLPEVLKLWGDKAIGKNAAAFPYFPLLIKLIDAKDRLTVQVHPDDTYALKSEGEFGKTEIHCEDSFTSLLVLEGKVTVKWKDGEIKASKGASIFAPAGCLAELSGEAELLVSRV